MLTHHGAHGKLKLFHLEDGGFNHQRDYKACITFFFNSSGDANNVRKCSKSLEVVLKMTLLSVTFVTPISAPIAFKKISHFFSEVKCWIGIIPLYFIKLERKIILL
ncbi:hypothetical protein [Rickettsia endosymbiont of Ixodes pacificus]|uniref:hypothetical protein n=1 Tax=Rickettsia endosymbiont of Ixodes pacificus TaxID=1133329 RepID=UPI0012E05121|nr:hypothetical protein [Rickettsia endosymbiont of Ixodes pacificus]